MNKEQLSRKIASNTHKKLRKVKPIVEQFCQTLADCIVEEEKVVLTGFGTFYVTHPKSYETIGINKQKIRVENPIKIHFRAGRLLKKKINN